MSSDPVGEFVAIACGLSFAPEHAAGQLRALQPVRQKYIFMHIGKSRLQNGWSQCFSRETFSEALRSGKYSEEVDTLA